MILYSLLTIVYLYTLYTVIHVLYFCVLEVHKSQNVKTMKNLIYGLFFTDFNILADHSYTKYTEHWLRTTTGLYRCPGVFVRNNSTVAAHLQDR